MLCDFENFTVRPTGHWWCDKTNFLTNFIHTSHVFSIYGWEGGWLWKDHSWCDWRTPAFLETSSIPTDAFVVHHLDRTRRHFAVNKWMGSPQTLPKHHSSVLARPAVYCATIVLWLAYLWVFPDVRGNTGGCLNARSSLRHWLTACQMLGMHGS